ncbi:hypothetical protein MANES_02G167801v8 [Manihot esculenta]|uniref:Uncharacterized protein n=1 Tax=Manihot esculenta TaxID=3983 RepID=A0ACB7I6J7_MANES|nr:hypothetical protein MANES_02G167801v8 [Manihot esculenta]
MDLITLPLSTHSLNLNNIDSPVNFPSRSLLAFLFPQGVYSIMFEAFDVDDQPIPFRLSIRRVGAYPKPVLCQALWRRYVAQKNLQLNDRVFFSLEINRVTGLVRYRVMALRRMFTLFGQDIWVNVEKLHH